jgi:hypothetical protein
VNPEDRLALLRGKLAGKQLPRRSPRRAWYGDGAGLPCDGCDDIITRAEIQVEVVFSGIVPLRLHAGCFVCWRATIEGPNEL